MPSTCKQAVVLAAGSGSRIAPTTTDPKCLLEVGGIPIIESLLIGLRRIGIENLVVVGGYKSASLRRYLESRVTDMALVFIDNDEYESTNNIYSLWLARDQIHGAFVLAESDVFIEPRVVAPLRQADRMAVARCRSHMTGTLVDLGADGRVKRLILEREQKPELDRSELFKTVNLYSFSQTLWQKSLRPGIQRFIEQGRTDEFYEAALADEIDAGAAVIEGVDVSNLVWAGIDTPDDLERARDMLRRRG